MNEFFNGRCSCWYCLALLEAAAVGKSGALDGLLTTLIAKFFAAIAAPFLKFCDTATSIGLF